MDAFEHFPKKIDAVSKFFQYIPDIFGETWPPLFKQHILEMRTNEPSRDWIRRHASIPNSDPGVEKVFLWISSL